MARLINWDEDYLIPDDSPIYQSNAVEEMALTTSLALEKVQGVPYSETYRQIVSEMEASGQSPTGRNTLQLLDNFRNENKIKRAVSIISNPDNTADDMLDALTATDKDAETLVGEALAVPAEDDPILNGIWDAFVSRKHAEENIKDLVVDVAKTYKTDITSASLDFLSSAIPFSTGVTWAKIAEDVMPAKASVSDYFLPGEVLSALKLELRNLPGDEKLAFAKRIAEAIQENAGFLGHNDYLKYTTMQEVFADVLHGYDPDAIDFDRYINDAIGLLDSVFIGQVGKAWVLPSRVRNIGRSDPNLQSQLTVDGLDNQGMAGTLGFESSEEIAELSLLPLPEGITREALPAGVLENWLNTERVIKQIEDQVVTKAHYFENEKAAVVSTVQERLSKLKGAYYNPTRSHITFHDDGVDIRAMFGDQENLGFANSISALEAGQQMFPGQRVRVWRRTVGSNRLREMDNSLILFDLKERGDAARSVARTNAEYFYSADLKYGFNKDSIGASNMFFPEGSIHWGTTYSKFLTDPDARFHKLIAQGGNVAHDLGQGISAQLTEIVTPFLKLKGFERKKRVTDAIRAGENVGTFTPTQLSTRGLDAAEQEGYYALRSLYDSMYSLSNARLYREMSAEGRQVVRHNESGRQIYATPLEGTPTSVTHVYSMLDGEIVPISQLPDGVTYARAHSEVRVGRHSADFIAYGPESTVGGLPLNVLRYIPGYIPRYYDDSYFVVKNVDGTRNGFKNTNTQVVYTASSKTEAERVVAQLTGDAEEGVSYDWKLDRNLNTEQRADSRFQSEVNRGSIIFGKRGDELTRATGQASEVRDPMRALTTIISKVSKDLSHEDFIVSMKRRFMNTYGNFVPVQDGVKKFPTSVDILTSPKGSTQGLRQAKAVWDYINHMEGLLPDSALLWQNMWHNIADRINSPAVETFVRGVGKKDPLQRLRGMTFNAFLALAPLRQLIVQSQQATFLAGLDPAYVLPGIGKHGLASDMSGLSMGLATYKHPDTWSKVAPAMSKFLGVSTAEYKAMVKAFGEDGLTHSIDSHTFARDAVVHLGNTMSNNKLIRIGQTTANAALSPLQFAKWIGFDTGELLNLQASWLMARRRWIKENPGKNWNTAINRQEIVGKARSMALSMTRAGQFGYQKGWLSAATQFSSIQHKALAAMLPKKVGGSDAFNSKDKMAIAATQAMLWGAAGIPLLEAGIDYSANTLGIDLTVGWKEWLNRGLAEKTINEGLSYVTGDDVDVTISGSLAPAGGVSKRAEDLTYAAMMKSVPDLFLGPSASMLGRLGDAWTLGNYVVKAPNVDTLERLRRLSVTALWTL